MFSDEEYGGDGMHEVVTWYELAIEEDQSQDVEIEGVCNNLWTCSALTPDIEKLYQYLKQHEYDPHISKYVRGIIDGFMMEEPLQIVDTDELPF